MKLLLIESPQRISQIINRLKSNKNFVNYLYNPNEENYLRICDILIDLDPTPNKNISPWLGVITANGVISIRNLTKSTPNTQVDIPEDAERVTTALADYIKNKTRLPKEYRDINMLRDFESLEKVIEEFTNKGRISSKSTIRKAHGAEIIYNDKTYTVYRIKSIKNEYPQVRTFTDNIANNLSLISKSNIVGESVDNTSEYDVSQRVKAVEELGMGPPETSWCTRRAYKKSLANHYLLKNDIYIIYKHGKPFIQKCGSVVRNVDDIQTQIPQDLSQLFASMCRIDTDGMPNQWHNNTNKFIVITKNGKTLPCDRVVECDYYIACINNIKPIQLHFDHSSYSNRKHKKYGIVSRINGKNIYNGRTAFTVNKENIAVIVKPNNILNKSDLVGN